MSATRFKALSMAKQKISAPNPIDIHVGGRLRQLRNYRGLTQEQLAGAVGVTFQQVQKYERGTNRVGASRLFDFSKVLGVSVASFFEGMSTPALSVNESRKLPEAETSDPFQRKETVQLVRAYYRIQDPNLRKKVLELAELLAETGSGSSSA